MELPSMPIPPDFWANHKATSAEKLRSLSEEDFLRYRAYFSNILPELLGAPVLVLESAKERIELLANESSRRFANDLESENKLRHVETMAQGREVLSWTKTGARAAIAAAVLAGLALIPDIPLSKLLHAMSSRSTPTPASLQSPTASPSKSLTAIQSPSIAVTASPMPSATATKDQKQP